MKCGSGGPAGGLPHQAVLSLSLSLSHFFRRLNTSRGFFFLLVWARVQFSMLVCPSFDLLHYSLFHSLCFLSLTQRGWSPYSPEGLIFEGLYFTLTTFSSSLFLSLSLSHFFLILSFFLSFFESQLGSNAHETLTSRAAHWALVKQYTLDDWLVTLSLSFFLFLFLGLS